MDVQLQARLLRRNTASDLHARRRRAAGADRCEHRRRDHTRLSRRVEDGSFREDLYYHLNVVPLRCQPLTGASSRTSRSCWTTTSNLFVSEENLPTDALPSPARTDLRNYAWPGNVRELKNVVQRLLILGSGAEIELRRGGDRARREPAPGARHTARLGLRAAAKGGPRAFRAKLLGAPARMTGGNIESLSRARGLGANTLVPKAARARHRFEASRGYWRLSLRALGSSFSRTLFDYRWEPQT